MVVTTEKIMELFPNLFDAEFRDQKWRFKFKDSRITKNTFVRSSTFTIVGGSGASFYDFVGDTGTLEFTKSRVIGFKVEISGDQKLGYGCLTLFQDDGLLSDESYIALFDMNIDVRYMDTMGKYHMVDRTLIERRSTIQKIIK